MTLFLATATLLSLLFWGVAGYFLVLIARFYRLKFSRGPKPIWMQAGLVLMFGGLLLRLPWFAAWASTVSQGLLTVGGLVFSGATYMLYRSMMTPQ